MFSKEEGEGWTQLGEATMPNSSSEAGTLMDSLHQFGERTLHSVFGGTSLPELHEAVGAMFGSKPIELNAGASLLPDLQVVGPNVETAAVPQTPELGQSLASPAAPGADSGALASTAAPGADSGALASMQGTQVTAPAFDSWATLQSGGAGLDTSAAGYFKVSEFAAPGQDGSIGVSDQTSSLATELSKGVTEILSKMQDMIGSMLQGPMGLLGGLLNFLLTIFTEILSSIGQVLAETARAAAALAAEAWKKHLEMLA